MRRRPPHHEVDVMSIWNAIRAVLGMSPLHNPDGHVHHDVRLEEHQYPRGNLYGMTPHRSSDT